jgi:hypothetical protein
MKYYCALCSACLHERRDGFIPDGGGIPLCHEHARNPLPPLPLPPLIFGTYEFEMTRLALAGTPTLSIADIVRPADATLQ